MKYVEEINDLKNQRLDLNDRIRKLNDDKVELRRIIREQKMAIEFGREAKEGYHLTRNLMSKGVIEIKDGTPSCCDPSTETYHCM